MTAFTDLFVPPVTEAVVTLGTRPHVTLSFLLLTPQYPIASVILLPGGHGDLELNERLIARGSNNFLIRTREAFGKQGFQVAVIDAPSDRKPAGMRGGFRQSVEHVVDIEAVANYLKKRENVPVWLIGMSRGAESAVHVALHCREAIAGLVLASAISQSKKGGGAVTRMQLESLKIPVLIVAHREDACEMTPASGAERIKNALTQSPRAETLYFEGGSPSRSKPCEALSAHGFFGIEREVVDAVTAFIKSNIPL